MADLSARSLREPAGADVVFTFDEHGGVHEELGDVGESLAEAFGEKGLEELVLKGMFGMFVHGLGLFCLSSFRLKAMNGLRNPLGGGAAPGESPIPLRSIGLSPGESQVVDLRFYRRTFTLPQYGRRAGKNRPGERRNLLEFAHNERRRALHSTTLSSQAEAPHSPAKLRVEDH